MRNSQKILPAIFLILVTFFFAAVVNGRSFRNTKGKTIEAELIEIAGDSVVLKVNGENFNIPIVSLSSDDQAYIKEWGKKNSQKVMKSSGDEGGSESDIKPNWDGEWPKSISADLKQEIEVLKEDETRGEYIYASAHYEFICDVRLNKSLVKRFSLLFEATNLFCRELPIGMTKPFGEDRHRIHLFETRAGYFAKGGPQGSAGCYMMPAGGGEGDILVPLTSLGVERVGSGYSVNHKKENATLSHEITHQITDYAYYARGSGGWFTEGLSEYIAQSGYRSGRFDVNDIKKLKAYVTASGENGMRGRRLGTEFTAPDLEAYFGQSYSSFVGRNGNLNYGLAPLIVYYFFHMDGEKDAARIKGFLKALKDDVDAKEAYEFLLDGRSFDELEADITKAWRSRGIKLKFQ